MNQFGEISDNSIYVIQNNLLLYWKFRISHSNDYRLFQRLVFIFIHRKCKKRSPNSTGISIEETGMNHSDTSNEEPLEAGKSFFNEIALLNIVS